MFRAPAPAFSCRPGVILLVVVALLTLFALVGLSFVLYADAQARAASLYREAQRTRQPDLDPELLLSFFLGQFLCDVPDDESGVWSALRGHSLARSLYGFNDAAANDIPFNGTGRLHLVMDYNGRFQADDFQLVNYTYFPADGFLRDPERPGHRVGPEPDPLRRARRDWIGGFNAPYTYPDLNSLFLAAVKADGAVLTPSFHRSWLFGPLDDRDQANWKNAVGKYLTLRPREFDQRFDPAVLSAFPYPEDEGGDVKNLVGGPGGNDSVWIDLGFPVQVGPDGRKFKPLFAPLVVDLDGRINLNIHGNVRGRDDRHLSNQGWGPWEVNPRRLSERGDPIRQLEWARLLKGDAVLGQVGRYGPDRQPGVAGGAASFAPRLHVYAQVDLDGRREPSGQPSGPVLLPGVGATAFRCFPSFPALAGYDNASAVELCDHPSRYHPFRLTGGDRAFDASNLEALLRYGDTGSPALTSELLRLCPLNFADPRIRRLVTTHSFDLDRPGLTPWLYDPASSSYYVSPHMPQQAPNGPAVPFPAFQQRSTSPPGDSEFIADWRARALPRERLNLNRPLPPYPHQGSGFAPPFGPPLVGPYDRFDIGNPFVTLQYRLALRVRQQFADEVYRLLLAVTGVQAPANRAAPSEQELLARRWLAQLAVNIVDFIDEDDLNTPFNFYTAQDAGDPAFDVSTFTGIVPEFRRYWVFGTELPRVVLNEVLVEYGYAIAGYTMSVWAELFHPLPDGPLPPGMQPQDGLPIPLHVSGPGQTPYSPYRLVVARTAPGPFGPLQPRPRSNDNVLGTPFVVQRSVEDFPAQVATVANPLVPSVPAALAPQQFFLLGPPSAGAAPSLLATVPGPTPLLQSPSLSFPQPVVHEQLSRPTVLLRRLANPHLPPDPNPSAGPTPNPRYNPYVTVDYIEAIPLHGTAGQPDYASWGKCQPYAADPSQAAAQSGAPTSVRHTFGRRNQPVPAQDHYDWLVHLDRPLISPMELLHVSAHPPHQLTHRFVTRNAAGDVRLADQRAPWFDQTCRLYRLFEYLTTRDRSVEADTGRVAGKININTVWDPEVFRALCDAQGANGFDEVDVDSVFRRLVLSRSPNGTGASRPDDRPFLSLTAGFSEQGPGALHPDRGRGINDTLLRSLDPAADLHGPHGGRDTARLFQVLGAAHPFRQYELLTKIWNHLTTRSNVFAVWVTVGFFAVTDDTSRPVKLGAEVGRAENRHVRRRMFVVVDRSVLRSNPGPQERFRAGEHPGLVPYLSVIE